MAEPTNQDRADWAEEALNHFGSLVYSYPEHERENIVGDFLADLFHFCERADLDIHDLFDKAERVYQQELIEDEAGEPHPEGHYKGWNGDE